MNTLNEAMKEMLSKQLAIQATTSKEGFPDIGPKRSLRVYDDKTLIYNENTGGQTLENIRNGSKMSIAIVDKESVDGYRFFGTPELFSLGSLVYESGVVFAKERGLKAPKYVVLIHIEEIFSLKPSIAGKKL